MSTVKILKEYWFSAKTVRQIASDNSISVPDLYKIFKEYDVTMKNKKYYDARSFEHIPKKTQDFIETSYKNGDLKKEEIIKIFNVKKDTIEKALNLREDTQTPEIIFISEDIEALRVSMRTMKVALEYQDEEERILKDKREVLEEKMNLLKQRFEEICSDIGDYINGNVR